MHEFDLFILTDLQEYINNLNTKEGRKLKTNNPEDNLYKKRKENTLIKIKNLMKDKKY
jgi:hypothetical protein